MAQGASVDVADHGERRRVGAGEEADEVVEQADLRLEQEASRNCPTTAGDSIIGSRISVVQKAVAVELAIDEQRQAEAEQRLRRAIDQKTKCAVVCIAAQISGSVRMSIVVVDADRA